MPNWCNNNIKIYGDLKTIKALTNVIKTLGEDERLFQSLIGLPNGMTKEEYAVGWYDTNVGWFGTKWDVSVSPDCFNFSEEEIEFFCETAWSPPLEFLINLCRMYKVDGYIFYSEPGMAFSGETKIEWENGELSINDTEYQYTEGLYHLDNETFWYEMESNIEYAIEEGIELSDFIQEYESYVSEEAMRDIKIMFNEQKKAYDEQQTEVE